MLNCVYHPVDEMRVVDNEERERLLASGFWYDNPLNAEMARQKVENKIKSEPNSIKTTKEVKKHEKSSDV